ncbi:hypothetical protein AGABI1DRAFT_82108 [Agaricus bisporus var. burnettii JB137-S8]|uniref:Secreted protein n=1 Tax=Agaricus bisporus var. burnettii (strain JB137-S8 / ATCC MYA-4627 / FGSC 10392) TaxID=597362 RepID=K5XFU2_AGABU|nr:uncharacterized protein AGABI1DRAFT_82108 [Agaricus bisporus var. burnettii JB137-S8]EKM82288.1 hypothetical protein AGABI1DRAFT_82108 [Agaricus bisporus var. burnettii JB137-S8]
MSCLATTVTLLAAATATTTTATGESTRGGSLLSAFAGNVTLYTALVAGFRFRFLSTIARNMAFTATVVTENPRRK